MQLALRIYLAVSLVLIATSEAIAVPFALGLGMSLQRKTPANVPQIARDKYNEGMASYRSNEYATAEKQFIEASKMIPSWEWPHQMLSSVYGGLKRNQDAWREAKIALHLDTEDEGAWLDLVGAYLHSMHIEKAIQLGNEYLKRFPKGKYCTQIKQQIVLANRELERRKELGVTRFDPDNYLPFATEGGQLIWNHFPLKVYIADARGVKGFDKSYSSMLPDALNEWQNGTSGIISFTIVTTPENCDIDCAWTDNPADLGNPGEGGECVTTRGASGFLEHARVRILTRSKTHDPTTAMLKAVCLHEVGHALGIRGHSDDCRDAMDSFASDNMQIAGLTCRDLRTVCRLYVKDPPAAKIICGAPKLYANKRYGTPAAPLTDAYYTQPYPDSSYKTQPN